MKRLPIITAALLLTGPLRLTAGTVYWDTNDVSTGAGASPTGAWDSAFWSVDPNGEATPGSWTAGDTAVFSAGTDAVGSYTVTLSSPKTAGGLKFEDGTVTVTGSTLTLNAASVIDVAPSKTATVSSIIAGTSWIKANTGTLLLTANNTFTGGITINGGVVQFNGEGTSAVGAATPTGVLPATAQAAFITLNGGTLRSTRTGLGVTFLAINKGITLGASGGTLEVTNLNGSEINIYSGVITGTGNLTKDGIGILALAGASNYSGSTTINAGELRIRSFADRLPTTTAVTVNAAGKLNLNGLDQKIGSLSGSGIVGLGNGNLTVGDSSNTTFSGTLVDYSSPINGGVTTGEGKVTKVGSGTLTLSGLNTYTGTFTLSGGIVIVDPPGGLCGAICDIVINGGTLSLNNKAQTVENLNGASSTINLGNGHTLTVNPVSNSTYSGTITGSGSFTKKSNLMQTLDGANTYTGATIVGAGTLFISGSLTGTSNVEVSGTLSGSGSIIPALGGDIDILANGKLSPASSSSVLGRLTITLSGGGTLDLSAGVAATGSQSLLFDLATPDTSDTVKLTGGALSIGTGVLEFDDFVFTPQAGFAGGTDYVLFNGSVPIVGTLGNVLSGMVGGFPATIQLADGGNDIVLHVIPEPASGVLILAGLGSLAGIRRRKRTDGSIATMR